MSTHKLVRIALLCVILYISKVILEFLPNAELVSLLTVIYALVFGREAFWIVTVFNMLELAQWGFGLWWISYLYVWPLLVLITLTLSPFFKDDFLMWAVVSGGFGLIFGGLFAAAYCPVSPTAALSYWISGLQWDLWHGFCNFVIMIVLGKPMYLLLKKYSSA